MSLKQELQRWSDALVAFDRNDYDAALALFEAIEPNSKIYFNIGLLHATRGEHERAIEAFESAIQLDPYLAVAYFQAGVSRFLLRQFDEARRDFDDAWLYLRSNEVIDYDQIGLRFQLYSCEVLFNRGLCLVRTGRVQEGLKDWSMAIKEKRTQEHDVIDEACADKGHGYTVFSVSVGTVFRPSESKLANLASRDFLGKTTVVAAASPFDLHGDFTEPPPPGSIGKAASTVRPPPGAITVSRSRTVIARAEGAIDGLARPLRRRPTLEERKNPESQLERPQALQQPVGVAADDDEATDSQSPSSHSTSVSKLQLEVRARKASFAEKKHRRNGLTIRVPPLPATLAGAPSHARPSHLQVPLRRTASVPSPSSKSPRPHAPHLRSASLPSPNVERTALPHDLRQRKMSRSRSHRTLPGALEVTPASESILPVGPSRQGSESSSCSSGTNYSKNTNLVCRVCLSPVDEQHQHRSNASSSSSYSGAALLAYLDTAEPSDHNNGTTDERAATQREASGGEQELRIRLNYQRRLRAMVISRPTTLVEIQGKIRKKLSLASCPTLSYRDFDNCLVSLVDEEDWQIALDTCAPEYSSSHRFDIIVDELDS